MNELIFAAIPVMASVLGTTIVSVACKKLMKKIVSKTVKNLGDENASLKNSLKKLNENIELQQKEIDEKNKKNDVIIEVLTSSNEKLHQEISEVKNQNSKLDHISEELAIIRNVSRNEKLNKEK